MNQIKETASRSLVRLMIFTCWLSFLASAWLYWFDTAFGWFALFWFFVIIVLVGSLGAKEKEK